MKLLQLFSTLAICFIAAPSYSLPSCGTPPKLVFILDDSGSIDDNERAQMTSSINKIIKGVQETYPETEFGAVQYYTPPLSSPTPQDGTYDIILEYTKDPTLTISKNPAQGVQDHLPDSIEQMIKDGIFAQGGKLEKPDTYFIYTDAWRTVEGCCSHLSNSGTFKSTDAAPDFEEYKNLANLSSSGDITLYHILYGDINLSPEVAQGNGIYKSGSSFATSDADIEAIIDNLVENIGSVFTGDVTEVALPLNFQIKTDDHLFIPSKSLDPSEGHLKAYKVDSTGQLEPNEKWDAATKMTAKGRELKLYTTTASGNTVLFNNVDDAAFGSTGTLAVSTIKSYTIDPSFSNGDYLSKRKADSFFGTISKGNDIKLLTNSIDSSLYLSDTDYRAFYKDTISTRKQLVLVSSDDGFLYAFNQSSGDLEWAWMPRTLVSELSNYRTFPSSNFMAGHIEIMDIKDSSGSYSSYVVGSYKKGLGHYVLKLNDDGSLADVVWDEDLGTGFVKSPNNGEMEFFKDDEGDIYFTYTVSSSTTSLLRIHNLSDSGNTSVFLNFVSTSTPFVMMDYERRNAPTRKTIYLGTSTGTVHTAPLLSDSTGTLHDATTIQTALQSGSVTSVGASEAIIYLDASVSAKDDRYYLSTQTQSRLTIHKYSPSDTTWDKSWTSFSTGAGSWDEDGKYTTDHTGVPADKDGFLVTPGAGIQSLPTGTIITDKATIVADSIVLPLADSSGSIENCYKNAYYYMFSLSDGKFPEDTFITLAGDPIDTNIALGYGEARKLGITDQLSTNKLLAYGIADKKTDLTTGIATSFMIKDAITAGVRGWREIGR